MSNACYQYDITYSSAGWIGVPSLEHIAKNTNTNLSCALQCLEDFTVGPSDARYVGVELLMGDTEDGGVWIEYGAMKLDFSHWEKTGNAGYNKSTNILMISRITGFNGVRFDQSSFSGSGFKLRMTVTEHCVPMSEVLIGS